MGRSLSYEVTAPGYIREAKIHSPKWGNTWGTRAVSDKTEKPRQRTEDLVVRAQGEETLILDRRTDQAHCLPAEVTLIWEACTGRNTLAEIAAVAGVDELAAARAVDELMDLDLLEVPAGLGRRKLMKTTALVGAGAVTAAAVTSIALPAAAQAQSPTFSIEGLGARCAQTGGPTQAFAPSATLVNFLPGTYTYTFSMMGAASGNLVANPTFTNTVTITGQPTGSATIMAPRTTATGATTGTPFTVTLMVVNSSGQVVSSQTVTLMNFTGSGNVNSDGSACLPAGAAPAALPSTRAKTAAPAASPSAAAPTAAPAASPSTTPAASPSSTPTVSPSAAASGSSPSTAP